MAGNSRECDLLTWIPVLYSYQWQWNGMCWWHEYAQHARNLCLFFSSHSHLFWISDFFFRMIIVVVAFCMQFTHSFSPFICCCCYWSLYHHALSSVIFYALFSLCFILESLDIPHTSLVLPCLSSPMCRWCCFIYIYLHIVYTYVYYLSSAAS